MSIYRLVRIVDDKWITEDFSEANVIPAMSVRGYEHTGPCTRKQLRSELKGQPMFKGLAGPMWGGDEIGGPVIRYECAVSYSLLSA